MDAQRGGHLLFGHHKQWDLATKAAKNPTLNVLWLSSLPYHLFLF